MRILHVLDHSLPLQSGYAVRSQAILKTQRAAGWHVEAITGPRHPAHGPSVEQSDGVSFHRMANGRTHLPLIGEGLDILRFAQAIDTQVRRMRPDILHVHSPALNGVAALAVAKRHGLPLVYEIRAFWEDASVGNDTGREGSARYRATRALETWVAKRATTLVTICEGLRGDLIDRGHDAARITVVPNAVDMSLFGAPPPCDRGLAQKLGLAGADVLGFIGSFYPYEGLADLIAAMPVVRAHCPKAKLLLVGGGPQEQALRAQAAASPVADHILFAGRVPLEAVEHYYALIRLLVYPRRAMRLTELVTPLKPLEAMAQRRLVAASDIGGHRELIRNGETGLLFPPDDPAALAASLVQALHHPEQEAGLRDRAQAYIIANRTWAHNLARYQAVYHRLLPHRQ